MNIVILGSGRGSNAKAILEAEKSGNLGNAKVTAIYSDVESAPILDFGPQYGKKSEFISPAPFKTKLDGEAEDVWISTIQKEEPDLIVLAGFMRVIKSKFIQAFDGKIINLHPSLLPSFPGLNGIGKAFDYGVKYSGCTVHWVELEVDMGRIIDQAIVPIEGNDTLESFEGKIHAAEHILLPQVIAQLSNR